MGFYNIEKNLADARVALKISVLSTACYEIPSNQPLTNRLLKMNVEPALKQAQCMFINDCFGAEKKAVLVQGTVVELSRPDQQLHPTRPLSLALDDGTGVLKVAVFNYSSLPHLDKVL